MSFNFASFWFEPKGFSFPTEEQGEKIVLLLRAHPITLLPAAVFVFILSFLAVLSIVIFGILGIDLTLFLPYRQIVLIYSAYFLFIFGYSLFRFLLWYFNIYLVTNERIIDFDFHRFLHREISDTSLSKIQDVTSRVSGPVQTFFNFGHVFIKTAAEASKFEFDNVPHPDRVAKEISIQARLEGAEPPGVVA
jgi:membrane protein YdbS with pleckstrin-like domain